MGFQLANEERSTEFAIIVSYLTSASGLFLKKLNLFSLTLAKPERAGGFHFSQVKRLSDLSNCTFYTLWLYCEFS